MPPDMIVAHASWKPPRIVSAAPPWPLLRRLRRLAERSEMERCLEEVEVVGSLPRLLLLSREVRARNSSSAESD